MAMHTRGQTHAGPHAPGHATTTHPAPKDDGSPLHSGKLSDVAASAVRRWFLDAVRVAVLHFPNQDTRFTAPLVLFTAPDRAPRPSLNGSALLVTFTSTDLAAVANTSQTRCFTSNALVTVQTDYPDC